MMADCSGSGTVGLESEWIAKEQTMRKVRSYKAKHGQPS